MTTAGKEEPCIEDSWEEGTENGHEGVLEDARSAFSASCCHSTAVSVTGLPCAAYRKVRPHHPAVSASSLPSTGEAKVLFGNGGAR